jgi:hypothetical protein
MVYTVTTIPLFQKNGIADWQLPRKLCPKKMKQKIFCAW